MTLATPKAGPTEDIVERLLTYIEDQRPQLFRGEEAMLREAADTIAGLRRERDAARGALADITTAQHRGPLDFIRALPAGTDVNVKDVTGDDRKTVFNAFSYLARTGELERLGYGRYRRVEGSQQ